MSDPDARLAEALADRYRLDRELGRGGMARVYLARDLRHDRNVALKVLDAGISALVGEGRFHQEILVTARLRHPSADPAPGQEYGRRGISAAGVHISDRIYWGMNGIQGLRQRAGVTQAVLAEAGGTSQPTVAAYETGQKSPTLTTLRRLAGAVGLELFVAFHPPMTREERRSLGLHHAIARRLVAEPEATLARARHTLLRMAAAVASPSQLLREWELLLERPVPAIVEAMLDPSPWARELRHVTPFAGVLTPTERTAVYREFAQSAEASRR